MKKYGFLLLYCGLVLSGCNETPIDQSTQATPASKTTPMAQPSQPKEELSPPTHQTQVLLTTSKGAILLELYPDKAPLTVDNFLAYVREGYYDGTIFHRVIPDFMIQGGGLTEGMTKKLTKAPVKNEASNGLGNARGTIAMARTNNPDSATSQFFINVKNNTNLDYHSAGSPGYTVFGKVIKGMDVVDTIVAVPTTHKKGRGNVPVEPILILSAKTTN